MTVIFGMEEKNENSNVIESVMTIRQPNNQTTKPETRIIQANIMMI